ncbi:MAG TPA: hypothetical protein VGR61_07200, partial [Candidatus Dormibacteraeota bacterium]|nr:hypothetical protein [Candidatus Dormibacteraeota bacterium]
MPIARDRFAGLVADLTIHDRQRAAAMDDAGPGHDGGRRCRADDSVNRTPPNIKSASTPFGLDLNSAAGLRNKSQAIEPLAVICSN